MQAKLMFRGSSAIRKAGVKGIEAQSILHICYRKSLCTVLASRAGSMWVGASHRPFYERVIQRG